MQKKILSLFLLLIIFAVIPVTGAGAEAAYTTYQYNYSGEAIACPDAYEPICYLSGESLGVGKLNNPKDMVVDVEGNLYISDTGNNRIVILDRDMKVRKILTGFSDEAGDETFQRNTGLFITSAKELYICDSDHKRIIVLDQDYKLLRKIEKPDTALLPDEYNFTPEAVAVDKWGRTYVVSTGTTYGIMVFNAQGIFESFAGAPKTTPTLAYLFWRAVFTKEQLEKTANLIPVSYNNINIDTDGFLYAISTNDNTGAVIAAAQSRSTSYTTYLPLKKFNFNGTDVLKRQGFFPPAGDVSIGNAIVQGTVATDSLGPSKIVDVALGNDGIYSLVDSRRNKIISYDSDGNFLYAFGGTGVQIGLFKSLQTAVYYDDRIFALDGLMGTVAVFKETEYGQLIRETIQLTNTRQYDQLPNKYREILDRNSGSSIANSGIAKMYLRQKKYKEAMIYFKRANYKDGYSQAFQGYRKQLVDKIFFVVPFVLIGLILLISFIFKKAKQHNDKHKNKYNIWDHLVYAFHVIFKPFDGFWDLRYEKRGSTAAASILLVMAVASLAGKEAITGYLFQADSGTNLFTVIVVFLGFIALFCIANWCITTLTDGKGTMVDIYNTTCYSLFPLILLLIPSGILTNVLSTNEANFVSLITGIAFVWTFLLLFCGIMVTHHYSLFRNIFSFICTAVGMMIIIFIGFLLVNLCGRMATFVANIITELSLRI